jgi:exosortase/archaeosortase family protein
MPHKVLFSRSFIQYFIKFILLFCILYYGTIGLIAVTSPGGFYSKFLHDYFDYVTLLRSALLHSSKFFLSLLGYKVEISDYQSLKMASGSGVHIGYDCIGYGVLFFWMAFIFANKVPVKKKIRWIIGGVIIIWIINVLRISLLLLAIEKNWHEFFAINNHTAFNIVAYAAIFTMIYLFDRSEKIEAVSPLENINQ